jgi:hypothetical protein
MIEWGAEIRKGAGPWWRDDEDRPGWLGDAMLRAFGESGEFTPWRYASAHGWSAGNTTAIRLPADHPAYLAIAHNMRPWSGGERAPDDWTGRPEDVLEGDGTLCPSRERPRWRWLYGGKAGDAIGYTPTTAPTVPDVLVQRMVRLVRDVAEGPLFSTHVTTARAILAELEPGMPNKRRALLI